MRAAVEFCNMFVKISHYSTIVCKQNKEKTLKICKPMIKLVKYVCKCEVYIHMEYHCSVTCLILSFSFSESNFGTKMVLTYGTRKTKMISVWSLEPKSIKSLHIMAIEEPTKGLRKRFQMVKLLTQNLSEIALWSLKTLCKISLRGQGLGGYWTNVSWKAYLPNNKIKGSEDEQGQKWQGCLTRHWNWRPGSRRTSKRAPFL